MKNPERGRDRTLNFIFFTSPRKLKMNSKFFFLMISSFLIISSLYVAIISDQYIPQIRLVSPDENSIVSDKIDLVVEVEDKYTILDVSFIYKEKEYEMTEQGNKWIYSLDTNKYNDGEFVFDISVCDTFGHENKEDFTIFLDNTAPFIEIVENASNEPLLFSIFDVCDIVSAKYKLNGKEWKYLQYIGDSLYKSDLILDNLAPEVHNLTVYAADINENERIEEFELNYQGFSENQDDSKWKLGEISSWTITPLDADIVTYSFSSSSDPSYDQKHIVTPYEVDSCENLSITIENPSEGDILDVEYVNTTWISNGEFDNFEILLDETSVGNTSTNWFFVQKIGTGWHTLKVIGYSTDGEIVFDSVYFDPIDPTYPIITHSPYRDLNSTNIIESQQGLMINITVTDDIGVSAVFLESNHTGYFKNYTMNQDGATYYIDIDISNFTGSNRFCYRFFANDTDNKWTVTDRSEEYNANSPFLNYFWVKVQYQIKKVLYWEWDNDTSITIPISKDLSVNGIVFSWYLTKWHKPGWASPSDQSVRDFFQKYIDAGFEIWINLSVTKGTTPEDIPYAGYKEYTQDRATSTSGIADSSGSPVIITISSNPETPIDSTDVSHYWDVEDVTDGQWLAYGNGVEEWTWDNQSATLGHVTIHNPDPNHEYRVWWIYHHWHRIDPTTEGGADLILTRMLNLLANHSDQITGIFFENLGLGGGLPLNPTPLMQDLFEANTSLNFNLKYASQGSNQSLFQAEWTEFSAKKMFEFTKRLVTLMSNFTVIAGWYRGDTNAGLSPEYCVQSGMLWEENWQGLNSWQYTREHLYFYETQTDWAYNDNGQNMDYSFCHYVGSGSLEGYQDWIINQRSLVALGAYPERINIAQSTNDYGLGGYTPSYTYQGIKEWINDFTQIHSVIDHYEEYTIATVGVTNKLVMRYVPIGPIWYTWDDRTYPVNFRYVNLEEIDRNGVSSDIDVLWLDGRLGGATNDSTLDKIRQFVENGGGLLVTGWESTKFFLNLEERSDTGAKNLLGINFSGEITPLNDPVFEKTASGQNHWITKDLPTAWSLSTNSEDNDFGKMFVYSGGLVTPTVLYTIQNVPNMVGMSVGTLGNGRVAFILDWSPTWGAGGLSPGQFRLVLFSRTVAWLSQNENKWSFPTSDNMNLAYWLYLNDDSFLIAIFNENQEDPEYFILNLNVTPISFYNDRYVLFDAYNWQSINHQPFYTQNMGIISFSQSIDSRQLMLVIGRNYTGYPSHIYSNRTFVSEYWDMAAQKYHLLVENNGFSAISSPFSPSSISEQGYNLDEVNSFSNLALTDRGWYYNETEEIIYLKSLGGFIDVDYKAPVIALISPSNNSVVDDNQVIDLDIFDLQDDLDTVLYNWNGNDNSTLTEDYDLVILSSFNEGINILNVYANDTAGHWTYRKFIFTVDNIFPSCSLISPLNGSTVSGIINVHINAYDANLEKVYLIIDSSTVIEVTYNVQNDFFYNLNTTTLSNGYHSFQAMAIDSVGHQNLSSLIKLHIYNEFQTSIEGISDSGSSSGEISNGEEELKELKVKIEFSDISVFQGTKIHVKINVTDEGNQTITDALVKLELLGETFYCYLTEDETFTYRLDTMDFVPGVHEIKIIVKKSGYFLYEETRIITIKAWFIPGLFDPEIVGTYLSDSFLSIRVGLFSIIMGVILFIIRNRIPRIRYRT
ncbi:MAG: hypothetical protein AM326_00185 [Candidatus Thorarchaeota archaeon SMTZ-45]|nr:MAG: hypothetical protein AM326_00185 [Candidatus Thorarchaeota archaeon SMTZ-45]